MLATKLPQQSPMDLLKLWSIILLTVALSHNLAAATQDILPHPCDLYECPPLSEIQCPDDSQIRDSISAAALLDATIAAPAKRVFNATEVADEMYAKCCLSKKCVCKTCYIPDCHNEGEVVVELEQETMDAPGHCCGKYECHREPNCTEISQPDIYWLRDCQRCNCYSGAPICLQSCDEGMKKPAGFCISKNLNKYFAHSDTWKDGCYECECIHGEEKCAMPFCRSVNCGKERQIMLEGSCCPTCWPKGIPMPTGGEGYDYEEYEGMRKPLGVCYSKNVNKYFDPGALWKDGCALCECVDGKEKCKMPVCPSLNCPEERQVRSKNYCCPVCWPQGIPIPNVDVTYKEDDVEINDEENDSNIDYDEDVEDEPLQHVHNEVYVDNDIEPLPNIRIDSKETVNNADGEFYIGTTEKMPSTTDSTTTTVPASSNVIITNQDEVANYIMTTTAQSPTSSTAHTKTTTAPLISERLGPCNGDTDAPTTYQVFPEVVEVIPPANRNIFLYIVILCLVVAVGLLIFWNLKLRAKQRSYRPVSNIDDNFNKMPSNIKKTNESV